MPMERPKAPNLDIGFLVQTQRRRVMRFSNVPVDNMFVLLYPGKSVPVWYKGKDGDIRKIFGGIWHGCAAITLSGEEKKLLENDPEVQIIAITPPINQD